MRKYTANWMGSLGVLAVVSGCSLSASEEGSVVPDEGVDNYGETQAEFKVTDLPVYKTLQLPNLFGIPGYENLSVPVYRSRGCGGPGILLVHGNSSSSRSYIRQVFSSLGDSQRLYLIDLPGYGNAGHVAAARPLPVNGAGIPQGFAEYQLGLVEAVAIAAADPEMNPKVFAGWSLGGDVLLLARGLGLLNNARGIMIFGTAPTGVGAPATQSPFLPPNVPGIPSLGILPSFGFAFQPDPTSPIGFNLSAQFTDPVPPYAPAPINAAPTTGDAYVRAFFRSSVRLAGAVPPAFREDAFVRADPRARASIGAVALGLLPPSGLPDELAVLRSLSGNPTDPADDVPIAVALGAQDAFINPGYLSALAASGGLPTLWKNKIISVPSAGHAIHYENPSAFNSILGRFAYDVTH